MKELKVQPIRNGTVIDHIAPGAALSVLRVLGLPRAGGTGSVTIAMNVASKAHEEGVKDIVKVEDRELDAEEVSKVALISPHATINIVREYEVTQKREVKVPEKVQGMVRCPNRNCVTNHEPVQTSFTVTSEAPVVLRCGYCERDVTDVADHIV